MVKQTFLNLDEEKRRHIISLAYTEFATHTYTGASLSRIVERAGIAKGSIYQYFDDRMDLYLYLLEKAAERKLPASQREHSRRGQLLFSDYAQACLRRRQVQPCSSGGSTDAV